MMEDQNLIDELVGGARDLFTILYAQQAVLTAAFGDTWQPSVSAIRAEIAPYFDELFAPLRDEVCEAFDQNRPSSTVRRIVRRMVDTAAHPRA
jgi:hypothetical protein